MITGTLLRVKVASLPVAYLKQLFCGLQTLEIMVLTLSSCDCWSWLTCELIVTGCLFSLSPSLQTALSSFFQETNIPGHHHQMVSLPEAHVALVQSAS